MTAPATGTTTDPATPPAGATPPGDPANPAAPATDSPLGEPGLKALQEERAAREAAEKRVKEFEKAQQDADRAKLGNEERLALERDEHKTTADRATAELNKLKVAVAKGVPADLIDRLTGSTVEELEADADKLLGFLRSLVPDDKQAGPGGRQPFEFLPRGGGDPTVSQLPTDPSKLADLIPRGYHGR